MKRKKEQPKILTPFDIRVIRTTLNLNQKEFAERCGFSASFIWLIECGRRRITPAAEQKIINGLINNIGLTEEQLNKIIYISKSLQSVVTD
ncbi:helix-turn-helix domain-containing protein [Desulfolucanica intricata]|uniref:helix-turn-helix domain-containing protein n=1 Tax=Desulfolucanica intricata TaxID=1285191 RepID=UPI000836ADD9|nr:helix-turn-helix transcriptional regulator [Desulfolucanica intricata]